MILTDLAHLVGGTWLLCIFGWLAIRLVRWLVTRRRDDFPCHLSAREPGVMPDCANVYLDPDWQAISRALRRARIFCEHCGIRPSEHADHIIPHRHDPELFWNPENLQALCALCHDKKTIQEDRMRRRGERRHALIRWNNSRRRIKKKDFTERERNWNKSLH